ncbi:hypothetical protein CN514_10940 [Bacillus sp. AFS001701]|uniref:hypothetical protein n=1 Tax=Bacillus sp. AFS001701 TaxID=2033480 RepID=UPI000BF438F0|nr:hypothetical protein [Bacillus sp. AFS001701]PET66910.1 hypothetical protein CN514_10940 [Bacillus sp. AFS001701]
MNLNIDLVKREISDFSFIEVKLISDFHLKMYEEDFEKKAVLEIEFVIESNGSRYKIMVRFHNPQEIKFESIGTYHQISLDIKDVSERRWENIKLEVMDYEEDRLHFYCSRAEILDVRKTSYCL